LSHGDPRESHPVGDATAAARRRLGEPMTNGPMARTPTILAVLLASAPAWAIEPPVPPPLPGRGEAERISPTVRGLTTGPVANPGALSGPNAPTRLAPGSRVPVERRPDPKTPNRPTTAGPDPLTVLRQPQPLVPIEAAVEDRNVLDTSLIVYSPETAWPTGFRMAYEHPDDPSYSVRLDGALMLVYQDGYYYRRGGRTVVGMPPGAWFVIGRDDLLPRVQTDESASTPNGSGSSAAEVTPAHVAGRMEPVRLDLRVLPARPEPVGDAPATPAEPMAVPADPPLTSPAGLRILRDETYRRRFLHELLDRFEPAPPPVTAR
jgi:hypothetical protein